MPMEDTYGIQSRIGSIIVVERWYCCRGSPVFSDRNIHKRIYSRFIRIIYLPRQLGRVIPFREVLRKRWYYVCNME